MVEIKHCRNFVYQTAYHLVWCTKYRKKVLIGSVVHFFSEAIEDICKERGWIVIEKEIHPNHVHMFLSFPPSLSISEVVKTLKGTTSRKIFLNFPIIKLKFWKGRFWSPSYYVGTAGNVSAETIKRYINRAEHIRNRR